MDAIILASSSPRRRELLGQAGIPFEVVPGDVDEDMAGLSGTPGQKAEELAYRKAAEVAQRVKDGVVLGADTIVVCDEEIFGKPADEADARRMLERLNGREHFVITGIALVDPVRGFVKRGFETTKVRFARLIPEEIQAYINSREPYGKAGGYAIQGKGALLVESLEGCYSNVVGLPIQRLSRMLKELGISVLQ